MLFGMSCFDGSHCGFKLSYIKKVCCHVRYFTLCLVHSRMIKYDVRQAEEYGNGTPKIFEDKKLSTPRVFLLQDFAL